MKNQKEEERVPLIEKPTWEWEVEFDNLPGMLPVSDVTGSTAASSAPPANKPSSSPKLFPPAAAASSKPVEAKETKTAYQFNKMGGSH